MTPLVLEWLNLLVRWTHVIAAIMWIGDSFLFMWMDAVLRPPAKPRDGDVAGEMWMVHSGGFYEVVKRRTLAPSELPDPLYWFKWQAYTTWLSGLLLLIVTYHFSSNASLIEAGVTPLTHVQAVLASVALLAAAWFLYDGIWSSPLSRRAGIAAGACVALFVLASWGVTRLYPGRAAFLQLGAMLGTIMAGNVWRRIVPAQNEMLAATKAGRPADPSPGVRAKSRSIHNHYLTLPVLFLMLSPHFPSTYGHPLNWVVLLLVSTFGAALKHVMNARTRSHRGVVLAGVLALAGAIAMTVQASAPKATLSGAGHAPVSFAEVEAIVDQRCRTCHATRPTNAGFPAPPNGVVLERPEQIRAMAPRILVRAVTTKTMPLGNLTGMTEEERATLGAWIAQGAPIR